MASTDQGGFTGRTADPRGHYHDGSYYTDAECPCALAEQVATGRPETDPCERGTAGCSVRHARDSECQPW